VGGGKKRAGKKRRGEEEKKQEERGLHVNFILSRGEKWEGGKRVTWTHSEGGTTTEADHGEGIQSEEQYY